MAELPDRGKEFGGKRSNVSKKPGPICSERPDNFIQWISHHPTICAKIKVFPRVQANMHTLTTAKFGSVKIPWTTFNELYFRP